MIRTKFIEVAIHIVEHDEMKIHFVIYLKRVKNMILEMNIVSWTH